MSSPGFRLNVKARCLRCQKVLNIWIVTFVSVHVGDIITTERCPICGEVTPFEVVER